jgi:hypothetical protein
VIIPLLKGRADVYFAGHDHTLAHMKPVDGVSLFISGGGGANFYAPPPGDPQVLRGKGDFAFSVIDATPDSLTVRYVDRHDVMIYSTTLRSGHSERPSRRIER